MSFYLLTFNENWADEHNVPALACFNEEQFQNWKQTEILELDQEYEIKLEIFNEKYNKYENWVKFLKSKDLWTKKRDEWPEEYRNLVSPQYTGSWQKPKKGISYIYHGLGNGGEGFKEKFGDYETPNELIDDGIVTVTEVSEDFYTTFNKQHLYDLSLCNIFKL